MDRDHSLFLRAASLLTAGAFLHGTAGRAQAQPCDAGTVSPDFATAFSVVGSAHAVTGDPPLLRLTEAFEGQSGAAWYTDAKIHAADGFAVEFTVRFDGTADGLAFVLQNESNTALGGGGSGMGYGSPGITQSLAVELDTFSFGLPGEFPEDHISIQTQGSAANSDSDEASLAHVVLASDLNDSEPHVVRIEYDQALMEVFLDGTLVLSQSLDLTALIGDNILDENGCIFAGFTAATGAAFGTQDILAFNIDDGWTRACVPTDFQSFVFEQFVTEGDTVTLSYTHVGSGPLGFEWRDPSGTLLVDDARISGANSDTLTINGVQLSDDGDWSYGLTNVCSGAFTGFTMHVTPLCACTADFDQSGGTPDSSDIDAFFTAWLAGEGNADADCSGGTPDASDIDVFFVQWLNGGC